MKLPLRPFAVGGEAGSRYVPWVDWPYEDCAFQH